MRLALDARTLQSRPLGGIGRLVRGALPHLAPALEARDLGPEGVDLLTDARLPPADADAGADPVRLHPLRAPLPGGFAWLQSAVPRWLADAPGSRPAVFHCPFYGLPYRQPVPMVVSIYDVTFLTHRGWFTPGRLRAFRWQARTAARTARAVITGSQTVAADLAEHLRIPADKVVVARPVVDRVFLDAAGAGPPGGEARPYLVALGGAPRRRLPTAVAAWRRAVAAGADVDLVVVGPEVDRASPPRGRRRPGRHRPGPAGPQPEGGPSLRWAGRPSDPDLAALLAGALAFVYPTQFEGFGLPAAEAAAAGTPVICAPVGALPEVLGPEAEWCEEPATGPIAEGILALVTDPDRAAALGAAGHRRWSEAPGWPEMAAAWAEAYRRALP